VKLLYAIAFALFALAPVTASAQSADLLLLSAPCSDDSYEDTAGRCGAIFTIEAILAKYGVIIADTDDEVIELCLNYIENTPVGSIQLRNEDAVSTDDAPSNEQLDTIASRIIIVDPPSEIDGEATDDIATTGPNAQSVPVAAEPVDDNRIE
jgi:hypothetical protein